jgi:hypothetical protein
MTMASGSEITAAAAQRFLHPDIEAPAMQRKHPGLSLLLYFDLVEHISFEHRNVTAGAALPFAISAKYFLGPRGWQGPVIKAYRDLLAQLVQIRGIARCRHDAFLY